MRENPLLSVVFPHPVAKSDHLLPGEKDKQNLTLILFCHKFLS